MIELSTALTSRLAGDATLTALGVTGVFDSQAPETQATPFVVFTLMPRNSIVYTKGRRVARELLYDIKAVDEGNDKTAAAAIDERIDALLTDQEASLPLTGGAVVEYVRREGDIDYAETDLGKRFLHVGGMYRIFVAV